MKKLALGKICIVAILALSLVYAPVSNQPTRASAPQSNQRKMYVENSSQHLLKESQDRGLFVIHRERDQTVCKDATVAEAQEFKNSDPNLPLQVINPTPQSELTTN